jgi:hypothetical protein
MSHLYEHNKYSLAYYNEILASHPNLPQDILATHTASIAFNTNILSGITTKLINQTIRLGDPKHCIYCYGLTGRPWEFVVHATLYNVPLALIDSRHWNLYIKNVHTSGFTIDLNNVVLRLKMHALRSNSRLNASSFQKIGIYWLTLQFFLWRLLYLIYYALRILRELLKKHRPKSISAMITELTTRQLVSVDKKIQIGHNTAEDKIGHGIGIVSKDIDNFAHYIWNDALGIVTISNYVPMPQNLFLLEGPYDFTNGMKPLLTTPISSCKLSLNELRSGFCCSYPVLACRSIPVLRSSATQLANQFTTSESLSNEAELPSDRPQLIPSDKRKKFESKLHVLFTLRLGSRPWLDSMQTIFTLSQFLAKLRPNICIIIDGMTFCNGMETKHLETMRLEMILSSEIEQHLQKYGYECSVITGLDLSSKMNYYNMAGLFIQPLGSANQLPSWILQKPVIVFGSLSFYRHCENWHIWFLEDSGAMHPFMFLAVDNHPAKNGYTISAEQVIKSITEDEKFIDILTT